MSNFNYDLFVIGAGSGGVRCSRFSSQFGAKVAVADSRYLGGTCVNVGCVPKKLFVYGAHYAHDMKESSAYGFTVSSSWDWATLRDNKTKEIERLNGIYKNLLDKANVAIINGEAEITGPNEVKVGNETYTAKYILIATGTWPFMPDIPGIEHAINSNEAFYLDKFPERCIVVGGGYIGLEFANIFHGLGADVQLLVRRDLPLRGFDQDIREHIVEEIKQQGIQYKPHTEITSIEKTGEELVVTFASGETTTVDAVMYATGRKPLLPKMPEGLINLKENGAIEVNEYYQTATPSIYAIGDIIDKIQLTPVAIKEGMAVANTLFNNNPTTVDYDYCATAVFSQPNIGTVGLSEEEARDIYKNIKVYKSHFRPLKHTLTGSTEKTFMKLIVDEKSDKIVGMHMIGAEAGEMMQGFAVALKAGATKTTFDSTIGIHPTAAEEFVTMR